MKIAVIIKDATGMVHAGLDTITTVRLFEMPEEIAAYIKAEQGPYVSVSFAVEEVATIEKEKP